MREGAEVVGGAVALVVLVLILIAELEVDLAEDGFAVGRTKAVAPVLRGGLTITLNNLRRVSKQLVITQIAIGDALTGTIAPVSIDLEGQVTTSGTEFAVELQHTTHILRIAVRHIIL